MNNTRDLISVLEASDIQKVKLPITDIDGLL
jgi:hypothetical protein